MTESQTNAEKGLRFEEETIQTLKKLNFCIKQTKASYDQGIDFRGEWKLIQHPFSIPIIGQCKKEKKPTGAKYIRELEGVLSHQKKDDIDALGVFVSYSGYSEEAQRHFRQSPFPLILCKIKNRKIVFLLTNSNVQKRVPSLHIGVSRDEKEKEIVLYQMVNGELIPLNQEF